VIDPRTHVEPPKREPWIPPPPPLALDTPIVLPDIGTLRCAVEGLKRLQPGR
jgi:hypothetical protein